jgi:hypothetical protein
MRRQSLDDVEIARRQRHRRPVEQRAIHVVKLVSFIRREHLFRHAAELRERPAIDLFELVVRHRVACRIEPVEIPEREPRRVSQLAITVSHTLQDLVRRAHVVEIVCRRAPQPNNLRARLLDHFVRLNRIARRLVHRPSLRVERPAVCDHGFVRRAIVGRDADQERRVEPAAKLVAALDVHIRGPA